MTKILSWFLHFRNNKCRIAYLFLMRQRCVLCTIYCFDTLTMSRRFYVIWKLFLFYFLHCFVRLCVLRSRNCISSIKYGRFVLFVQNNYQSSSQTVYSSNLSFFQLITHYGTFQILVAEEELASLQKEYLDAQNTIRWHLKQPEGGKRHLRSLKKKTRRLDKMMRSKKNEVNNLRQQVV